jgi:hypothetical protein
MQMSAPTSGVNHWMSLFFCETSKKVGGQIHAIVKLFDKTTSFEASIGLPASWGFHF